MTIGSPWYEDHWDAFDAKVGRCRLTLSDPR